MDKEELYNEFMRLFTPSRLENLKLEEYTNLTKDSFCYWIENKLNDWGNIHGATSYKFGIFQWGSKPELGKTNLLADEKYAWQNRFGKTAEEAYCNIRKQLVQLVKYAEKCEFEKIDSIDLSEMFKWKIAFIYSNKKLINWFSKDALLKFAQYFGHDVNNKTPTSKLQRILLNEQGEKSLDDFNKVLQPIWNKAQKDGEWLPKDYNPNISKEIWIELIKDKTIFTENILITFACLHEATISTCTDMAKEFGRTKGFYKNNIWRTGKRVYDKINCPLSERENGENRYWPICCVARNLKNGLFEFKIRKELLDAFEETGIIKQLELYADEGEKNMGKLEDYTEVLLENYNLILHGAPGTGKTHLAKEIAAQMICGKSFEEIEKGSDEEKAFNEQTEFVQFHPSYDYSDFVEGIRPIEGENGEVSFERKDGIFKAFCEKALKKTSSAEETNFDDCWDSLIDYVRENLASDKLTKIGSWEYGLSSKESLKYSSVNSPSQYNFTITKQNVYDAYQGKKARPKGGFQKEMNQIVDFMKEKFKLIPYDKIAKYEIDNKQYIFIIDEINRGELSKIFGELFFSIEPSYRGKKGKVRTQYANMLKESNSFDDELNTSTFGSFFIPDNVYIIGTMNDIDRSVESMDFAMRRRFIFEEVTAEDSAENMNLSQDAKDRMTRINTAIHDTEGLNDAYKIGGAYFLNVDDFDKLWKIKLSSLIKEYLRGIDDDGSKYQKIEDAYFNRQVNDYSDNDE